MSVQFSAALELVFMNINTEKLPLLNLHCILPRMSRGVVLRYRELAYTLFKHNHHEFITHVRDVCRMR